MSTCNLKGATSIDSRMLLTLMEYFAYFKVDLPLKESALWIKTMTLSISFDLSIDTQEQMMDIPSILINPKLLLSSQKWETKLSDTASLMEDIVLRFPASMWLFPKMQLSSKDAILSLFLTHYIEMAESHLETLHPLWFSVQGILTPITLNQSPELSASSNLPMGSFYMINLEHRQLDLLPTFWTNNHPIWNSMENSNCNSLVLVSDWKYLMVYFLYQAATSSISSLP